MRRPSQEKLQGDGNAKRQNKGRGEDEHKRQTRRQHRREDKRKDKHKNHEKAKDENSTPHFYGYSNIIFLYDVDFIAYHSCFPCSRSVSKRQCYNAWLFRTNCIARKAQKHLHTHIHVFNANASYLCATSRSGHTSHRPTSNTEFLQTAPQIKLTI